VQCPRVAVFLARYLISHQVQDGRVGRRARQFANPDGGVCGVAESQLDIRRGLRLSAQSPAHFGIPIVLKRESSSLPSRAVGPSGI